MDPKVIKSRKRNSRRDKLLSWHRSVGVTAMVFVLIIAVTGILLNHSSLLGLDKIKVSSPWILSLYNIPAGKPFKHYPVDSNWLSTNDYKIYWNGKEITELESEVLAVVKAAELVVVATEEDLLLVTYNGEFVEAIPGPYPIKNIGKIRKDVIIESKEGLFRLNEDVTGWKKLENPNVEKPIPGSVFPATPPENINNLLKKEYTGPSLTVGRIILDIHSGRIMGVLGVIIADLVGLALIFLALTGLYVWRRKRR